MVRASLGCDLNVDQFPISLEFCRLLTCILLAWIGLVQTLGVSGSSFKRLPSKRIVRFGLISQIWTSQGGFDLLWNLHGSRRRDPIQFSWGSITRLESTLIDSNCDLTLPCMRFRMYVVMIWASIRGGEAVLGLGPRFCRLWFNQIWPRNFNQIVIWCDQILSHSLLIFAGTSKEIAWLNP